jgi:hypothetical protein
VEEAEGFAGLAGAVCAMVGKTERKNRVATTDFAIILAPFWVMIRLSKKV